MAESQIEHVVLDEVHEAERAVKRLKDLGYGAIGLFKAAEAEPDKFPRAKTWRRMSRRNQNKWGEGLTGILFYEDSMPGPVEQRILTPPTWEALTTAIDDYHDALPFSTPELGWLEEQFMCVDPLLSKPDRQAVNEIASASGEITEADQPQEVQGIELVERWWAWRRGVEGSEATGSFDLAYGALHRISALTVNLETFKWPFD